MSDRTPSTPPLTKYIEALRLTVPALATEVVTAARVALQSAYGTPDRNAASEVLAALQARGEGAVAHDWTQHLLQEVAEDVGDTRSITRNAPAARPDLELKLVDDAQIEEDIVVSHVIQQIESDAVVELRDLQARCTTLRGLKHIGPHSHPMRPEVCARALSRSADSLGAPEPLSQVARLLWLRTSGAALVRHIKATYADQIRQLKHQGVEPAPYRAAAASVSGGIGGMGGADPLSQLVQRAHAAQARQPAGPGAATSVAGPGADPVGERMSLRLLDEPQRLDAASVATPTLHGAPAQQVMSDLLYHFAEQSHLDARLQALLLRLTPAARHSAAADATVWHTRDHPLWQLLDRMATLGALYATPDGGLPLAHPVLDLLDRVVQQLEALASPAAADFTRAVTQIDLFSASSVTAQVEALREDIESAEVRARRLTLEPVVRRQAQQQMQGVRVPVALGRFVLGPWVTVMTHAMVTQGEASEAATRYVQWVDRVLAAGAVGPADTPAPGKAGVHKLPLPRLLGVAQEGLQAAAFGAAQVSTHLADLTRVLRNPAAAVAAEPALTTHAFNTATSADEPTQAAAMEPAVTEPSSLPAGRTPDVGSDFVQHGALPTVPIDMLPHIVPTRASIDRQSWLSGLQPGDVCRIFVQGAWGTRRLLWRSDNRQDFIFSDARGEGQLQINRRALERLRSAGLATTIERGSLLGHAMSTLPMALDAPSDTGPSSGRQ